MLSFLMMLHVLICFLLVMSVLLQAGKGGGLSGSFGTGGSQALFGGRGAATFFSKATVVLGALFFASSLALAMLSTQVSTRRSLVQEAAKRANPESQSTPPSGGNRPAPVPPGTVTATGTPVATPSGKPAATPSSKPAGTQPAPSKPQGK
jgi:preprotein translocase subunit SecG